MNTEVSKFLNWISETNNPIFRGHANKSWDLKPSIGRYFNGNWNDVIHLEQKALELFKKKALPHLTFKPACDLEWLCLMQHHGCPTRLLDFTTNPLVALFFASDPNVDNDGVVISAKYRREETGLTDSSIFNHNVVFAYYPPHLSNRVVNQASCFIYSVTPNKNLGEGKMTKKYTVDKFRKIDIRKELQLLGITYSSIFPGIDGVCKDIQDELTFKLMIEGLL